LELGIKNKRALVTGAGRGIGRAVAKVLAAEGADVLAVSRTGAQLDSLVEEISAPGQHHAALALDLMTNQGVQSLVEFINEDMPIDIIVHNLGGTLDIRDPFCSVDDWRQVYRLNLEIPIELNVALVPKMVERGWGRVVHISSVAAMENQGPAPYCAMKAALTAYTRSIAGVVAKDGVIMSSVLPGAVITEGGYWETARDENTEHYQKFVSERMRIGRMGEPEEIANAVAFFCSELASFAVGSVIPIDGGQGRSFFGH
jgi:NAD(P)-dependent dehydrogenase (short-subunit alcohol dehydrogenase family)